MVVWGGGDGTGGRSSYCLSLLLEHEMASSMVCCEHLGETGTLEDSGRRREQGLLIVDAMFPTRLHSEGGCSYCLSSHVFFSFGQGLAV